MNHWITNGGYPLILIAARKLYYQELRTIYCRYLSKITDDNFGFEKSNELIDSFTHEFWIVNAAIYETTLLNQNQRMTSFSSCQIISSLVLSGCCCDDDFFFLLLLLAMSQHHASLFLSVSWFLFYFACCLLLSDKKKQISVYINVSFSSKVFIYKYILETRNISKDSAWMSHVSSIELRKVRPEAIK